MLFRSGSCRGIYGMHFWISLDKMVTPTPLSPHSQPAFPTRTRPLILCFIPGGTSHHLRPFQNSIICTRSHAKLMEYLCSFSKKNSHPQPTHFFGGGFIFCATNQPWALCEANAVLPLRSFTRGPKDSTLGFSFLVSFTAVECCWPWSAANWRRLAQLLHRTGCQKSSMFSPSPYVTFKQQLTFSICWM